MTLKGRSFIVALLLITSLSPLVSATNIQVSPQDSEDDAMITGIGNYFGDTPFLFLRDATTNFILGSRFRDVTVPQGSKINNATLFVRSIYNYGYPYNRTITATIAGDDIDNSAAFNDSSAFTRTYTLAYVVWNISGVNGNQWNNVSVTEIVQEIIDRIGWVSGNSLSLVIFTDVGTPRREFVSVDGNPAYTAYIDINYGVEPTQEEEEEIQDSLPPPFNETEEYIFEYNETYRGIDIWILTEIGEWLNFSTFEIIGAASGKISGLNDTWFQVTNMYTDSDVYLRRNYSVYRNESSHLVSVKFGIKWEGMPWSGPAVYAYTNMWGVSSEHDFSFSWTEGYTFAERTWNDHALGTAWSLDGGATTDSVTWFPDVYELGLPITRYYHIRLNMANGIMNASIWNDIEMTDLNSTFNEVFTPIAAWPWTPLYEYLTAPTIPAGDNTGFTGEYISRGNEGLEEYIVIVYPNGTLVTPDPLPEDVDPYDVIDDLLGGAQPEDPQEDEYGAIGKFRFKLLVLSVGLIMVLGSPMAGIHYGASTATWIKLLFVMFFGLGILLQIKFM